MLCPEISSATSCRFVDCTNGPLNNRLGRKRITKRYNVKAPEQILGRRLLALALLQPEEQFYARTDARYGNSADIPAVETLRRIR